MTGKFGFYVKIQRKIQQQKHKKSHLLCFFLCQDFQLFIMVSYGFFSFVLQKFPLDFLSFQVFFYPAVNKIVFDGLLPNWENNWNVLLAQENSYFCIRILDVLAGKFLRYHLVSGMFKIYPRLAFLSLIWPLNFFEKLLFRKVFFKLISVCF